MRRRMSTSAVALSAVAATLMAIATAVTPSSTSLAQATPPNIVLIITDDQRWDMLANMPVLQAEFVEKGMTFTQAFASDPLCCPSRTSLLRGQYAHTTRIYAVSGTYGGYGAIKRQNLQSSTIATWLNDAGYHTGLVGKYQNLYNPSKALEVPPGWDYWAALAPTHPTDYYYDYKMSYRPPGAPVPEVRSYGSAASDYSTRVFSSFATEFIATAPSSSPLFLYYAPTAPHQPFTPDPLDTNAACSSNPEVPSFGEADVSDKPSWVLSKPWNTSLRNQSRNKWVKQCRMLLGVDRSLDEIIDGLAASGRLSNTMFIYMSDNGMLLGEHRLTGKKAPYEESVRIPFIVRYDGVVAPGTQDSHLVANVDVAPTLLEVAGATAPSLLPCSAPCSPAPIEGLSVFPLLSGAATTWRQDLLLEHFDDPAKPQYLPAYCAIRTAEGMKYVRYDPDRESRFEELYALASDPYEQCNLASNPDYASQLDSLRSRLKQLCSPTPPQYQF